MAECNREKYTEIAEKLKALSHPVRLCIVCRLSREATNVSGMLEKLQIHQTTLSHHLMLLRTAGIIEGARHGNEIYYSIRDEKVVALARTLCE